MGPDTNTRLDRLPVGKHTDLEYLAERYGTLKKLNKLKEIRTLSAGTYQNK
jgi:hypothetical protein